jgi:hypothetical protein
VAALEFYRPLFRVSDADADAVAARAAELGGPVLLPPTDAPGFRSAVLLDPQGAVFSVRQVLGAQPSSHGCRFPRAPFDEGVGRGSLGRDDRPARSQTEETAMRFMVIVKASEDSEAGVMPTEQELTEMGAFNQELVRAGVMVAGEGLQPSSQGARVRYDADGATTVVDGPFAETKELIAGFWILEVSSREEVLEWVKKAPFRSGEVEVRQVFAADDFGDAFTPELRAQEAEMRAASEARHGG